MRSRHLFTVGAVVIAAALVFGVINRSEAQNSPAALTGVVSSEQERRMEGVMVSAKRAGSTVTLTVATDAQGRYAFPRNRLDPGTYSIGIRAVGYELDGPASAQVSAQQTSFVASTSITRRVARHSGWGITSGDDHQGGSAGLKVAEGTEATGSHGATETQRRTERR